MNELYRDGFDDAETEIKSRVGSLRQFINEKPASKMVTDEDILYFLGMATSEEVKESQGCMKCGIKSDIAHYNGCTELSVALNIQNIKNDLYLEPLNFDFIEVSRVSDMYMFQQSINNIIKVLNKITKTL